MTATTLHQPTRPVHPRDVGEMTYLSQWQAFNRASRLSPAGCVQFLRTLVHDHVPFARKMVTEREATVAASFVKWLGTNNGQAFVMQFKALCLEVEGELERQAVCLGFWREENRTRPRSPRLIQFILARDEDYDEKARLEQPVYYEEHDEQVIISVVRWLCTNEGLKFIDECERLIKEARVKPGQKFLESAGG
jgi:hypothetical protein